MSLQKILEHRRAVRHFDSNKPLDSSVVKKCIELATLAPTSSNFKGGKTKCVNTMFGWT